MSIASEPRSDHWQLQEAKQRLSEVIRAAETSGPQFVTRHGKEVVVIVDIDSFHKTQDTKPKRDLRDFLLSGPRFELPEIERTIDPEPGFEFED
jgi:prevent-host-death family protein